MSANNFFWRQGFQLKVHQASGEDFQRLFSKVMVNADPRFQSIAPRGNWGDGGNDGWIPEDGHYFQVYGPKPTTPTAETETAALRKAIEDFNKLSAKWKDVRRYSFVMNDRFQGTPAPIANVLQKLAQQHDISAGALSMNDLMERFMMLDLDKRNHILGGTIPELSTAETTADAELRLRKRFQSIVQGLKANCYLPQFGSAEYWEAEAMADKGWFDRLPSAMGYVCRGVYNPGAF